MGIFDRFTGPKDLRNDPRCPINVAQEKRMKMNIMFGGSAKTFGGITKDPNHPVCRQCKRKNDPICT